jgi:diaminopimelate epimerase
MLSFTKMHGLGNDFVVIDQLLNKKTPKTVTGKTAEKLCDRRFGIGADQLLVIKKAAGKADFRMDVWNADGTKAEMCGNGIRAVALYVAKRSKKAKPAYKVETGAGLLEVQIKKNRVRVDMGIPHMNPSKDDEELIVADKTFRVHEVNMGNPHVVTFVDSLEKTPVGTLGPQIENHSRFPNRTNVEFAQVESNDRIVTRVWERGAGLTLACGTGACAVAAAAMVTRKITSNTVTIELPGGRLTIDWKGPGHKIYMEGPAEEVFSGTFEI